MNRSIFETLLGALVIIVAIGFGSKLYQGFKVSDSNKSYHVYALFNNSGGLQKGADVRIAGVTVGKVVKVSLDNEEYKAKIEMKISQDVELPADSVIEIASDGFIGGKYVRVQAGVSSEKIGDNTTAENSKDVVSIEQMLGKLIFLTTEK
ncbi:MAG: MlaD family protein [Alphaproteobacteria bacterium]